MKISVIIPTYKPDYYIWECLDSLKKQNIDKKLFEVLIILNGEKEPFYTSVFKYINENNLRNFKLIYTEKKGVSNARNVGLNIATGQYICFVDDDDYIDLDYLKELLNVAKKYKKNGIVVTNYKNFEEKTQEILFESKYRLNYYTENLLKMRKVFSIPWLKLIPKDVIREKNFKNFSNGEDALFMLEISKNIKYIATVEKETFYNRRVRKDSANFRNKNISYILKNSFLLIKEYSKLFLKKEYDKKFIFFRILAIFKGIIYQIEVKLKNDK